MLVRACVPVLQVGCFGVSGVNRLAFFTFVTTLLIQLYYREQVFILNHQENANGKEKV